MRFGDVDKPRLSKDPHGRGWKASGRLVCAYGETYQAAYSNWRTRCIYREWAGLRWSAAFGGWVRD